MCILRKHLQILLRKGEPGQPIGSDEQQQPPGLSQKLKVVLGKKSNQEKRDEKSLFTRTVVVCH